MSDHARITVDTERIPLLIDFLRTLDGLKTVYRATYVTGEDRHENDAEHVAHMALFAMLLAPETSMQLDLRRVLELVLVHDLPEVIAGDTWAYDVQGRIDAEAREEQAAEELFAPLPSDVRDRLRSAWHEFENGETEEARFVRAVDRLHGFAQNVFSGGRSWRERGVTEAMTRERNAVISETDPALAQAFTVLLERARSEQFWTDNPDVQRE